MLQNGNSQAPLLQAYGQKIKDLEEEWAASIKLRNRMFGVGDDNVQSGDDEDSASNNMTQSLGNAFTAVVGENSSSDTPQRRACRRRTADQIA